MPLDPFYPLERLAFMLEDTDAPVLLITQQYLRGACLPSEVSWYLDEERKEIAAAGWQSSEPHNPDNLAYVIYTSGSTGQPKG